MRAACPPTKKGGGGGGGGFFFFFPFFWFVGFGGFEYSDPQDQLSPEVFDRLDIFSDYFPARGPYLPLSPRHFLPPPL